MPGDSNLDPIAMMEQNEKFTSMNENLGAIRAIVENAVQNARLTGGGMVSGLSQLRSDVSASLQGLAAAGQNVMPLTHTSVEASVRPHYGMFLHNQGLMQSVATSVGIQVPLTDIGRAPVGIDPYTYQVTTRERLSQKIQDIGVGAIGGAGEFATSMAVGAGAMKIGAMVGSLGGPVGTVIGGAIGLAAGFAVDATLEQVGPVARYTQRRELEDVMQRTSWRFAGTTWGEGALGGLSSSQREDVSRGIQRLSDRSMFSSGDVKTIFEHGIARGMYDDVSSTQGMVTRTSELMRDVKTVANRAHVPLDSAIGVMADLRQMGFTGNPAQAIQQFDVLGMVAGRTSMEMMAVGQQGAEMFRGTGINTQFGAMAAAGNLAQVRAMQSSGVYGANLVAQFGGAENMAMTQTANLHRFVTQDPLFRGMGMAMMGSGTMAGFDPSRGAAMLSMSPMQMVQQAYASPQGGFRGFVGKVVDFQMNQSEFAERLGPQGLQLSQDAMLLQQAKVFAKLSGVGTEGAMFMVAKQKFGDDNQAKAYVQRMQNIGKTDDSFQKAIAIEGEKIASEAAEERTLYSKTIKSIKGWGGEVSDTVGGTFSTVNLGISDSVSDLSRAWYNLGRDDRDKRIESHFTADVISKESLKTIQQASPANKEDFKGITEAIETNKKRQKDKVITDTDLMKFERQEFTIKRLQAGASEEDVSTAISASATEKGSFDISMFSKAMKWEVKDKDGNKIDKPTLNDMSSEQKLFILHKAKKTLPPEEYEQLEKGMKLQPTVADIKAAKEDALKVDKEVEGESSFLGLGHSKGLKEKARDQFESILPKRGWLWDSKLEKAMEKDTAKEGGGLLSIKMGKYIEAKAAGDKEAMGNLAAGIAKIAGISSAEVTETLGSIDATSPQAKDAIKLGNDLANKKKEQILAQGKVAVTEGKLSEAEQGKLTKLLGENKLEEATAFIAGKVTPGESSAAAGQTTAALASSDQNKFNADALQSIRLLLDEIKSLKK